MNAEDFKTIGDMLWLIVMLQSFTMVAIVLLLRAIKDLTESHKPVLKEIRAQSKTIIEFGDNLKDAVSELIRGYKQ